MTSTLFIVQIVLAILITIAVLLQKSSSIGLGAYSGSNESLFGAKGPAGFLTKITFILGFLFVANTLALGYLYSKQSKSSAVDSVKTIEKVIPKAKSESSVPAAPAAPTTTKEESNKTVAPAKAEENATNAKASNEAKESNATTVTPAEEGNKTSAPVASAKAEDNSSATPVAPAKTEANSTDKKTSEATEANKTTAIATDEASTKVEANSTETTTKDSAKTETNTTANRDSNISTSTQESNKSKAESKTIADDKKAEIEKSIKALLALHKIEFEVNKATLTKTGQETVDSIGAILKKYPDVKVSINGYTDSDGNDSYNKTLSQKRVDEVKAELVKIGIKAGRLKAVGYGEANPLVPNDSKENKAKNRRVEFKILSN